MAIYNQMNVKREFSELELSIFNYKNWVEKRLLYLARLFEYFENNENIYYSQFKIAKDTYMSFKNDYEKKYKNLLKALLFESFYLKKYGFSKKVLKLIELVKKPFDEIEKYPQRNELKNEEISDWLYSLVIAIENSVLDFINFMEKIGLAINNIQQQRITEQNILFQFFDTANDIYSVEIDIRSIPVA